MRLRSVIVLLPLLAVACGDDITLADGSTSLTYDCDQFRSLANSAAERAVVKLHAQRIARHAAEHRNLELLSRLSTAYEGPEAAVLERLVVRHSCQYGVAGEEPPPVFPEPSTQAHDFTLRQLTLEPPYDKGPAVTLSEYRGSVVVLDVFGTWCAPCLERHPAMEELARQYRGKDVRFFGILLNDSPKRAAQWFTEHGGLAYPFLLESGSDIEATWGLHGAPRMFVIDQQGLIVDRCLGCQGGRLSPDSLPVLLDSLLVSDPESRLTSASS